MENAYFAARASLNLRFLAKIYTTSRYRKWLKISCRFLSRFDVFYLSYVNILKNLTICLRSAIHVVDCKAYKTRIVNIFAVINFIVTELIFA